MQPRAEYLTFEEAAPLGFRISEVDEDGSVPELLAENPLDRNVLLYDGEELVGAKQNRILNVTVLVAPHAKTHIPVSCVEQGRWHRRSRAVRARAGRRLPRASAPQGRAARRRARALGAAQDEVWQAVAAKSARLGVHSPTGAQRGPLRPHTSATLRPSLGAFPLEPGQSGMVVALGASTLCLDYVSRPDAFAHLYPKLLRGAMLDAIEHAERQAGSRRSGSRSSSPARRRRRAGASPRSGSARTSGSRARS